MFLQFKAFGRLVTTNCSTPAGRLPLYMGFLARQTAENSFDKGPDGEQAGFRKILDSKRTAPERAYTLIVETLKMTILLVKIVLHYILWTTMSQRQYMVLTAV